MIEWIAALSIVCNLNGNSGFISANRVQEIQRKCVAKLYKCILEEGQPKEPFEEEYRKTKRVIEKCLE